MQVNKRNNNIVSRSIFGDFDFSRANVTYSLGRTTQYNTHSTPYFQTPTDAAAVRVASVIDSLAQCQLSNVTFIRTKPMRTVLILTRVLYN